MIFRQMSFTGMVEKLNSTISSLKACTSTLTDWVDCLQSVAMSIRSQPHESTGISPYEMMFGVPMRLPTELEDSDILKNAMTKELSKIMAKPQSGKDGKLIFDSVDKIRQIIHNSASGNISRVKAKQSFYLSKGTEVSLFKLVIRFFTTTKELDSAWGTSLKGDG